jgi:hypothetical protein
MKKINKKLSLVTHTVRSLTDDQLGDINGGGATPTTTVLRHRSAAAVAAPCRLTGGVHTAPCRFTA